jgi:hypothetical protein
VLEKILRSLPMVKAIYVGINAKVISYKVVIRVNVKYREGIMQSMADLRKR